MNKIPMILYSPKRNIPVAGNVVAGMATKALGWEIEEFLRDKEVIIDDDNPDIYTHLIGLGVPEESIHFGTPVAPDYVIYPDDTGLYIVWMMTKSPALMPLTPDKDGKFSIIRVVITLVDVPRRFLWHQSWAKM